MMLRVNKFEPPEIWGLPLQLKLRRMELDSLARRASLDALWHYFPKDRKA